MMCYYLNVHFQGQSVNVIHTCGSDHTKTFLLRNTNIDLKAFAQASLCIWHSHIFLATSNAEVQKGGFEGWPTSRWENHLCGVTVYDHVLLSFSQYDTTRMGRRRLSPPPPFPIPSPHANGPTHDWHKRQCGFHRIDLRFILTAAYRFLMDRWKA